MPLALKRMGSPTVSWPRTFFCKHSPCPHIAVTNRFSKVQYRIRLAQLSHLVDMPRPPTSQVRKETYARQRTFLILSNASYPYRGASNTPYFLLVQRRHVPLHFPLLI